MYQTAGQQSAHVWIFDIETAVRPEARDFIQGLDVEPDKRLKDPAKIEESKNEKRRELIEKAPLYWWFGKVVSIAAENLSGEKFVAFGDDERRNLVSFFNMCDSEHGANRPPHLVGKSSSTFDSGYLVGRAIAHDLGVPAALRSNRLIDDIDQCFSFKSGTAVTGKLANYAYAIGMAKSAEGGDVAGMVERGEWEKLVSYNQQDVAITAEIYRRYMKEYRRVD